MLGVYGWRQEAWWGFLRLASCSWICQRTIAKTVTIGMNMVGKQKRKEDSTDWDWQGDVGLTNNATGLEIQFGDTALDQLCETLSSIASTTPTTSTTTEPSNNA